MNNMGEGASVVPNMKQDQACKVGVEGMERARSGTGKGDSQK